MKYLLIILMLLVCSQCRNYTNPQQIIDAVHDRYVPDSRTGVFDVRAEYRHSRLVLRGETDNREAHAALLQNMANSGLEIADSIRILPYNILYPWAVVSLSVANMRISPSHDAELTTQASMGTPLKILKEEDNWVLIQTPDKYLAWCEKDAIRLYNEKEFLSWKKSKRVIVTEWFDFLRDSATHEVIGDLVAGCVLEYRSRRNDVTVVITPDGRRGIISSGNIADFDSWREKGNTNAEDLIHTAKTFMGTPYLWGGASVKAIDCSGFVKTVYFLNGIILSRDASQQALYGTDVPRDKNFSFHPGDLVFFGYHSRHGKPARITHVGMYLGNSEFIHSSGYVKINSFDSTRANYSRYRTISLLKVRRILGTSGSSGYISVKNHSWY